MTIDIKVTETTNISKLAYPVLIEAQQEGGYQATLLSMPGFQASGATREEALQNLRQVLKARLEKADIVSLEIDNPQYEHPWIKFAGMYKDNPLFGEVLENIEAERRKMDEEMEEYYRQLDAEGKA